jgi:hypothetical protein
MKASLALLPIAVALPLLACGHDDETRSPYTSGVQATGPVSTLDDSDLTKLCRSYDSHVDVNLGFDVVATAACLPSAILLGITYEGCQQRMAECKRNLPPPVTASLRVTDERACVANLRQCDQSVASLEGCINVNLDSVYRLIDSLTCGDVNTPRAAMANLVSACANASPGCTRFVEPTPERPLF